MLSLFVEWKRSGVDQFNQLVHRKPSLSLDLRRVAVALSVFCEVIQVEDLIREIGVHQHIDIEIDVAKYTTVKQRRDIHVAVEVSQPSRWFTKTKDVVPAIEPVMLGAEGPRRNLTEQVVVYVVLKLCIQYQKRIGTSDDSSCPATVFAAIVLLRDDNNLVFGID